MRILEMAQFIWCNEIKCLPLQANIEIYNIKYV